MSFAFPLGLLGLVSLPLIAVLHLLQQRNRTIIVSNLSLWSFLEKQVQGARFRRIPLNMLLIMDLSIAALFSLALAQPHLNLPLPWGRNIHQIVILDTSTSLKAQDVSPTRFEKARQDALSLAEKSRFGDVFTGIAAGANARILADSRFQSMDEILLNLQTLEAGGNGASIQEALYLAESIAEPSLPIEVHLFTDGAWDGNALKIPGSMRVNWHWIGEPVGNQAVLDVSASKTADQIWEVSALLANFSDQTVRRIVSLMVDDTIVESVPIDISPKIVFPIRWQLQEAPGIVSVALAAGDVLPDDDMASTTVAALPTIHIALVSEQPKAILKALKSFQTVDVQLYASASDVPNQPFDLVIYHQVFPSEHPYQTILLLDPPSTEWLSWSETVTSDRWVPAIENEIVAHLDSNGLRDVLLPRLSEVPSGFQVLLQTLDDPPMPVLLRGLHNQSDTFIFLPRISSGNFLRHPLWIALLGNVLASATVPPIPAKIDNGSPLPIPSPIFYPTVRLLTPIGKTIAFGEQRPMQWGETQQSGIYRYQLVSRFGIETEIAVGVNAGDWQESNLLNDQRAIVENSPTVLPQPALSTHPFDLTPWILGLACLILLIEANYAWR
ncbi:MAG: hypothetical protein DDG59_04965 [Anaerolineae bacterium]|jgi:hypothetical protein|nr:MAG: hypothetical protein DDG59_04965 [Anaerolineae bacterium]